MASKKKMRLKRLSAAERKQQKREELKALQQSGKLKPFPKITMEEQDERAWSATQEMKDEWESLFHEARYLEEVIDYLDEKLEEIVKKRDALEDLGAGCVRYGDLDWE